MRERLRIVVRGAVQGVGFRPFVYRLATDLQLDGWVRNSSTGVFLELEGDRGRLDDCLERLTRQTPPRAIIQSFESTWLDPVAYRGFEILESDEAGAPTAIVLPDIATCDDCRREILDPANRRHRYPFTNCTNCGPRFSIIEDLPYDRAHTSMRAFLMCPACDREYHDPADRRFHAQPNACPICGPEVALWDSSGGELARRDDAIARAIGAIHAGQIVAVKGIGGFHLMVDATNRLAVERLRRRKHREEKPFALMYPSFTAVTSDCVVSPAEARLLLAPEAPIVLLRRRHEGGAGVASIVAPGNPNLGAMLPSTPLHLLLLTDLATPVVATSGNVSDEPICTDEREAVERLRGIADLFLVHNRRIVRHVDDSIVRMMMGRELVLRRARGYAPLPVPVPLGGSAPPMIAVGGHLKNTIAITAGSNAFISQHIGDLESRQSREAFFEVVESFERLYRVRPAAVVADLHPDYLSTRYARSLDLPIVQIQHHHAHVMSCMAENDLEGAALGVAWDGTGYGPDGTIWGGEFLEIHDASFTRASALRPFRLPGGEQAVREPRRSAFGVLHEIWGRAVEGLDVPSIGAFSEDARRLLGQALEHRLNAPITTSAGRLFDAVASLCGLRQQATFEGQAAMDLEFVADPAETGQYPWCLSEPARFASLAWDAPALIVDWEPAIRAIVDDVRCETPAAIVAARFHNTLANVIVTVAERIGEPRVVLTGGCFQNAALSQKTIVGLRRAGFRPYWHQRVPPNDGGLALGQIAAALSAARASRPAEVLPCV